MSERAPQPEDGVLAFQAWQTRDAGTRPTAMIAANDVIALRFLDAARQAGVHIPEDLSLIGFDNDPGALLAGLTTIERPTEALGEALARVLLDRLAAGTEADAVTVRLRPVLIERSTVASPSKPPASTPNDSRRLISR
jgi:LacI family transcriptional regulator